ncbi:MAG: WD40 repeat domain-containing protein [bacterium]
MVELRHNSGVWQVVFSPDENLLAFGAYKEVHIWDLVNKERIESLLHNHWVNSVAFSPDGNFLVVGAEDGTIKVWRIEK